MKNDKKSHKLMNFLYELSCKMVSTKDNTLIIGDLKVKEMAQSKKRHSQNISTQNQGFLSEFLEFLATSANS